LPKQAYGAYGSNSEEASACYNRKSGAGNMSSLGINPQRNFPTPRLNRLVQKATS